MSEVYSRYTDSVKFFSSTTPHELVRTFDSPLYVYNEHILRRSCRDLLELSDHPGFRVNFSAKANTNPALLRIIREEGCLVDAMSPGELQINMLAGFTPDEILYVCNNVSADEFRNVVSYNLLVSVDSLAQLDLYGTVNPGGQIMVRINPGIGAGHHKKVVTAGKETKFGIDPNDFDTMRAILDRHHLTLRGINQHIGSLFMEPDAYLAAMDVLLHIVAQLPEELRSTIEVIDFGGGFGVPYHKYDNEPRLDLITLGQGLDRRLKDFTAATGYRGHFYVEPGRYIVAECGVLLGRVHAVKYNSTTCYVGTDLGFNVLMRPVLYDAWHDLEVYREKETIPPQAVPQTIVGNICESGDILAKNRLLPRLQQGDILGVLNAGAYGYVMASSYNQRPRPAEVLLTENGEQRLIRRRETIDDLTRLLVF